MLETLATLVEIFTVILAAIAAYYWHQSAKVKFPEKGQQLSSGEQNKRLIRQSSLSARAAISAAGAASFQAISIIIKLFIN